MTEFKIYGVNKFNKKNKARIEMVRWVYINLMIKFYEKFDAIMIVKVMV